MFIAEFGLLSKRDLVQVVADGRGIGPGIDRQHVLQQAGCQAIGHQRCPAGLQVEQLRGGVLGKQRGQRAEGLAACGLAGAAVNAWADQGDGAERGAEDLGQQGLGLGERQPDRGQPVVGQSKRRTALSLSTVPSSPTMRSWISTRMAVSRMRFQIARSGKPMSLASPPEASLNLCPAPLPDHPGVLHALRAAANSADRPCRRAGPRADSSAAGAAGGADPVNPSKKAVALSTAVRADVRSITVAAPLRKDRLGR